MTKAINTLSIGRHFHCLAALILGFALGGISPPAHAQSEPGNNPPVRTQAKLPRRLPANPVPAVEPPAVRSGNDIGCNNSPTESRTGVVNLNTATAEELIRLPGIGPSRAQAILQLRARLGGHFKRTEELIRVRGIGRKTFRKLAPLLTLQGPTTLVSGKKSGQSAKR